MKKSKFHLLSAAAISIIALAFFVFSCKKETTTVTTPEGFASGCDYLYGTNGYIVQEDGILNFRDADAFFAFIDTVPTWSDSAFVVWEAATGANTAYGNYIEADNALTALMTPYENDTITTDAAFLPTFNAFAQSKSHLASITTEGVEPYFSFPYYYFVNQNGIYRICSQEYSVQGSLLLSYPVGQQELVKEWNGQVGDFGELKVQQIRTARSSEVIQERDEKISRTCTDEYDGGKKRIKVFWDSEAFRFWDPVNLPGQTVYGWSHQAEIKAQKKSVGIWWSDTRHIALSVSGTITNRHTHPSIAFLEVVPVEFFRCERAKNIKRFFAGRSFPHPVNSNLNNFALSLTVTGTNRRTDCQTIQATCTMNLQND